MEQTNNRFPFFWPGQALSSQDLNESFGYIEEQERITRAWMTGNGILSGLSFAFNISGGKLTSVKVLPGFGVTPDGFPVRIAGEVLFTHSIPLANAGITDEGHGLHLLKSTSLLLTAAEAAQERYAPKAVPLSVASHANYCLSFYLEIEQETATECNLFNCNLEGSHKHLRPRLLLIHKAQNAQTLQKVHPFELIPPVKIKTLNRFASVNNLTEFKSKITQTVQTNKALLNGRLEAVYAQASLLFSLYEPGIQSMNCGTIFNTTSQLNQYHVSFQIDLKDALNEFIEGYNRFIVKYAIPAVKRLDRFLVLGAVSTESNDPYRYRYTGTDALDTFRSDLLLLQTLYYRIHTMLTGFIPGKGQPLASGAVKVVPCSGYAAPLGRRAIPFYYDKAGKKTLEEQWIAPLPYATQGTVHHYQDIGETTAGYYDQAFLLNIREAGFYRIEGHMGQTVKIASQKLTDLINGLDLPIRLMLADISNTQWSGIFEMYDKFKVEYRQFYELMRSKVMATLSDKYNKEKVVSDFLKPLNNAAMAIQPTNYYNTSVMTQQVNTVKSFLGKCNENNINHLPISSAFSTEFTNILKDPEVKAGVNLMLTKEVSQLLKKLKDVSANRLLPLAAYAGAESIGGVVKGGTFIMLYSDSIVIGDVSLPYWFTR